MEKVDQEFVRVWQAPMQEPKKSFRIRIGNASQIPCIRDQRFEFTLNLGLGIFLFALYPGGTTDSPDGLAAAFVCRSRSSFSTDTKLDFCISLVNFASESETIKRMSPVQSPFPNPHRVGSDSEHRVGWPDFVKWSDAIDATKGFLVDDELVWKIEVTRYLAEGRLVTPDQKKIEGSMVAEDIVGLWQSKVLSDITLQADGHDYSAHRAILGSRSPVFASMLCSQMKESQTGVVEIADVSASALEAVLYFIYTDKLGSTMDQPEMVSEVLKAAKKYEIVRLVNECEARAAKLLSMDTAIDFFILADMVGSEFLKRECASFISHFRSDVQNTDGWKRLMTNGQQVTQIMPQLLELLCPPAKRLRTS